MSDPATNELPTLAYWQEAIEHVRAGTFDRKHYRAAIMQMNDAFKAHMSDTAYWNGTTRPAIGSPLYNDIRDALEFTLDIKPMPWSSAFQTWILTDPKFDAMVIAAQAQPEKFNYDYFRGDFFEMFGHALAAGQDGGRLTSTQYEKDDPAGVRYVTMLADGSYRELPTEDVTRLLRDPNGPHVIVTANHAFLESRDEDVKPVFEAYRTLYDRTNGSEERSLATLDQPSLSANDTVMVMALHTRENKYLNLAQLFSRVAEIDAVKGDASKDRFVHTSPIAIETVAMILRSTVQENEIELITPGRDPSGSPQLLAEGATVHLTTAGIENLKRRIGEGFSKGGNDMRDAMRLLLHVLDSDRVVLPEGVSKADVMSHLSLTVTALNEMRMADYYRDNGIRVTHISNGNDTIAAPSKDAHDHRDPKLNYIGAEKWSGHAPSIAADGIVNDPRAHAHFTATLAGTTGRAALRGVHLSEAEGGIDTHVLKLEVMPGTTDAQLQEAFAIWREKMTLHGVNSIVLRRDKQFGTDRYSLVSGDAPLVTPENIGALRESFKESGIAAEMAVDEQFSAIKGALLISRKSGLPLRANEPTESADGLIRIDNRIRVVASGEYVGNDGPLVTSITHDHRPQTQIVTGEHSRIRRNTDRPYEPRHDGDSPARQHHDRIVAKTGNERQV